MNPASPSRSRLFRKYVILLVALFCPVLAASTLLEIYSSYQGTKRALLRLQQEEAQVAAAKIQQFITEVGRQIGLLADSQGSETAEQRRLDYLRLLRQAPAITDVSYVDASGKEQFRFSRLSRDVIGSQADVSRQPQFLVAKSGKAYFSPVYFREESEPYMTVSMAGSGADAGVAVAEVNLKFIWEAISRIRVGRAGHAYVVDSSGNLIAHPNISLVLRKTNLLSLPQVRSAQGGRPGPGRETGATIARDLLGQQVLTAHARIAPLDWSGTVEQPSEIGWRRRVALPGNVLDWSVFVEQPLEEAFQPVYATIPRSLAFVLGGLGLSVLASLFLAKKIVTPIQALQAGAARVGRGDLGHRIQIRTGDELEALGQEFNRTAARLQESYANLEEKVEARTQDLTQALAERRRVQEALIRTQERLQFLLGSTPAVLYSCAASSPYGITFVGANVTALTGFAPQDFLADPDFWARRIHPEDAPRVLAELGGLGVEGRHTTEYRFLNREGDHRWLRDERRIVGGEDGGPREILGDWIDITERKRVEEALTARTRQLEAVRAVTAEITREVELTPLLELITRRAAGLVGVGSGAIHLWDEAAQLLVTKAWHGYGNWRGTVGLRLGEGVGGIVAQQREGMIVNDYQTWPHALPIFLERARTTAVLAEPLLSGDRLLGVIVVSDGGTERRFSQEDRHILSLFASQAAIAIEKARLFAEQQRAYKELQEAQAELVRSQKLRALGQMAAGIAHDLNNTLAAILGQVELLQLRGPAPETRAALDTLTMAATDGAQVVRRLQDFARQRASSPLAPLDLRRVVQEALEITRPRWRDEPQRRGTTITIETKLDGIPPILGHAPEVREALINLVLNAVDAMPEGGVLTFSGEPTPAGVGLSVADTGLGMPEEIRERIFEPFFTTKGVRGTGLGLSVVYGIMERHGGHIEVTSAPGHGTVFHLRFRAALAGSGPDRPEAGRGDLPPRHLLVIDDDATVRQTIAALLRSAGHRVTEAAGGAEGLARLGEDAPDCVLTDLGMPELTGWDVARAVRARAPHLPVVLLTGWGEFPAGEAERTGLVDRILSKPVRLGDLLEVIRTLTRGSPAAA